MHWIEMRTLAKIECIGDGMQVHQSPCIDINLPYLITDPNYKRETTSWCHKDCLKSWIFFWKRWKFRKKGLFSFLVSLAVIATLYAYGPWSIVKLYLQVRCFWWGVVVVTSKNQAQSKGECASILSSHCFYRKQIQLISLQIVIKIFNGRNKLAHRSISKVASFLVNKR